MYHEHVSTRFKFWNGKTAYTLHWQNGLYKWFVFENEKTTDALAVYDHPKKAKVNADTARGMLDKYLETLPKT